MLQKLFSFEVESEISSLLGAINVTEQCSSSLVWAGLVLTENGVDFLAWESLLLIDRVPSHVISSTLNYKSKVTCFCTLQVNEWPYVTFFRPQNKRCTWIINQVQHTIITSDIIGVLDPPELEVKGCRFYYKFKGE